jgi:hypothetical protein
MNLRTGEAGQPIALHGLKKGPGQGPWGFTGYSFSGQRPFFSFWSWMVIVRAYRTSTKTMRLMPLQARTSLPSCVAVMLRTTPPPDGIAQVSCVFGVGFFTRR